MKRYGNYQYLETVSDVFTMLASLENTLEFCEDEALYIGLDTETKPRDGSPTYKDDALRWWGKNPGYPFLYIVGWTKKLAEYSPDYFLIPEELEWAFGRIVDFANRFTVKTKDVPAIEWVFFNRTFDLGMSEFSAGFKLMGVSHEAFTAMRVGCFIPDWWDDKRLKAIATRFIDPQADEPQDRLNMWKALYEKRRHDAYKQVLKEAGFKMKWVEHYQDVGLDLPFHVKQALEEWESEWPTFSYAIIPDDILLPYAGNDVRLTLMAFYIGMKMIRERGTMAIYEQEQRFYLHNVRQQCIVGWAVDREKLAKADFDGEKRIKELTDKLRSGLDWENCTSISDTVKKKGFNPNSVDQMAKLFSQRKLHLPNMQAVTLLKWVEDKGQRTQWADDIENYLNYKLYAKLHSTYVQPLLYWSQWDGMCHPSVRPDAAYTGRQGVAAPPLQQIPKKPVPEFEVRDFFICANPEEYRLWMFDFAGMEVTVFAEYCRDPVMLDALSRGADFHSMLALKAFEPARGFISDVTKHMVRIGALSTGEAEPFLEMLHVEHAISDHVLFAKIKDFFQNTKELKHAWSRYKAFRQAAKTGMFAILYGAGPDALSEQMSEESHMYISPEEASFFKQSFYDLYLMAKTFTDNVSESVSMRHAVNPIDNHSRRYGWIRNMYGRLYLMEPRDSYKGVNYLVQGSCADLMKQKIIAIHEMLLAGKFKTRIVLSIHDEIVFEMHKSEERTLVPIIKQMMEDNPELEATTLHAEASYCPGSWATKTEFDGNWEAIPA